MADKARYIHGKKFMWDGEEYEDEKKAGSVAKEYEEKGFEVQTITEDGKVLLYSRRVVTEIVLD